VNLQRHLPAPKPFTPSSVREKERAGEVRPYQYQSLQDSPWLVLVREDANGLLWPENSLARSLAAFSGILYLQADKIKWLEQEGFIFEKVQPKLRKL